MKAHSIACRLAVLALSLGALAHADASDLRNLERGEPVPHFTLPTIDSKQFDSATMRGSVHVLVYLSAEQKSSELAAIDSHTVVGRFEPGTVELIHATADVLHKPYFERFRAEKRLDCTFLLDASRSLYADLGLIVFPTTIVVNAEGILAHVISTRAPDYANTLDAYIRHASGSITDEQLAEQLKAHPSDIRSPRSLASRHRAAARLLSEKALYDAAKKELIAARELDPQDLDIQLDLADLCLHMDNPDEARSIVDPILEAHADHRRALFLKGVTLYRLGQLDQAETILLESIVLNPDPARTHYYLGRIYETRGESTKAIEHYREALTRLLHEPD